MSHWINTSLFNKENLQVLINTNDKSCVLFKIREKYDNSIDILNAKMTLIHRKRHKYTFKKEMELVKRNGTN